MTTPVTPTTPIQSTVKNGAAPTTPQAPAVPAPPPDATASELKTWQEKAQKAEALAAQKTREEIINRRKWDSEKKTMGEKLSLADQWLKVQKLAKVDKLAAAKMIFGDKALEELQTQAVNGGAPSAEAVQLLVDDVRAETAKKFEERDAAAKKAQEDAQRQAEETDRAVIGAETSEFYKAVSSEYPIFAKLGDEKAVSQILANNLTGQALQRYRAALASGDAETRVGMLRKVADGLENTLLALAEGAVSHEKYAPKLRDKLTPAKQVGTVQPVKSSQVLQQGQSSQVSSQARRTLTTDLTGTTPSQPSGPRSEDERWKATLARYAENASKT